VKVVTGLKGSGNKFRKQPHKACTVADLTGKFGIVPQRYLLFSQTLQLIQREFFMRIRTIFLILFIVLVAAFVALNVDEFTRISVLSLGFTTVQVSLGMVMLLLLVVATVVFLGSTLLMQSANLLETRKYAKDLNTQRDLADKAETSRFTELRQYLDAEATAERAREAAVSATIDQRFAKQQLELLARLDQSDNTMAAHLGQLQDRLEQPSPQMIRS
jgi:hypothetical protein